MEPLFTTQFAYTLEEYTKFNMEMSKRQRVIINILLLLFPICMGAINYFQYRNIKTSIISTILVLICSIISFIIISVDFKNKLKKVYYSNKTLDSNVSNYEFFKNEFKETDLHGSSTHTYSELTQIIETETNFYLMISKIQRYLI